MSKLLLVDDDIELTELLSALLKLEGFEVQTANNGMEALKILNETHQLVLMDIMMPVLNGIETLKEIRKRSNVPVMMLTARGDDIDRVIGLELGADDYLPKPFNDRELIARIKAILRRSVLLKTENVESTENSENENSVIFFHGIELHPISQRAIYQGKDLNLTSTEFLLFYQLTQSPNGSATRDELSEKALGKPLTPFDRSIDMHMSNLRKKLPLRENDLPWFKTLRGRGYLLVP